MRRAAGRRAPRARGPRRSTTAIGQYAARSPCPHDLLQASGNDLHTSPQPVLARPDLDRRRVQHAGVPILAGGARRAPPGFLGSLGGLCLPHPSPPLVVMYLPPVLLRAVQTVVRARVGG